MADVFSKQKRSSVMAAIRAKGNKDTEVILAKIFRRQRITGWRRHQPLLGKPDFVFRKPKVAIFVDGCFWHGCPKHGRNPESNRGYWLPKLKRNKVRDTRVRQLLQRKGWTVLRFWEHDLKEDERIASEVRAALHRSRKSRLDPADAFVEIQAR